MRKQIAVFVLITVIISGCNLNSGADIVITEYDELYDKLFSEGKVTAVAPDFEMFNNVERLVSASSAIIEGIVTKSEQKVLTKGSSEPCDTPNTVASVKITKVLKEFNGLKVGDIIQVKQGGGFKFVQKIDGIDYAYVLENYEKEYLKRDSDYLLFLYISDYSLENDGLCNLAAPVQGQYKINKDGSITAIESNTLNIDEVNAVRKK